MLIISIVIQKTNSVQIVEKDTETKLDRFEPNWESLDSRKLPLW